MNFSVVVLAAQNIGAQRGIRTTRCVCGKELSPFQLKKITTEYDHMYGKLYVPFYMYVHFSINTVAFYSESKV